METDKKILQTVLEKNQPSAGIDVQEIISSLPPKWVRWGTVFFLFVLFLAGGISWFIQYPDVVPASGELTAINAPKEIRTKMNGRLVKLFVAEGDDISEGEPVGYIQSTASHEAIIKLSHDIEQMAMQLAGGQTNELEDFAPASYSNLGELQRDFEAFTGQYRSFIAYLGSGFYLKKMGMLQKDMSYIKQQQSVLQYQKKLLQQDVALADSTFGVNQSLKNENIISPLEYRNEKSRLIGKQLTIPQVNSSIISNESQLHDKKKEIAALENEISQQKDIFLQAVFTLKGRLQEWKEKYILQATTSGSILSATLMQQDQELQQGQVLCYIAPPNSNYYAAIHIPQYKFGKIKKGQEVKLRFPAYPDNEFGSIKGVLDFIASAPTDSGYVAKVLLPKGLTTDMGKQIVFKTGLNIQAEIITERKRLLHRLFDNMKNKWQ